MTSVINFSGAYHTLKRGYVLEINMDIGKCCTILVFLERNLSNLIGYSDE